MTNVITFPKQKKETPESEIDAALEKYEKNDEEKFDKLHGILCNMFLEELKEVGINPGDTSLEKQICFFFESLRALLLKKYGKEHAYHQLADVSFELRDNILFYKEMDFKIKQQANGAPTINYEKADEYLDNNKSE